MNANNRRFSLPLALTLIVSSIFLFTGSLYFFFHQKKLPFSFFSRKETFITHLVLTGPQRDALSSYFFEEILDLSQDRPEDIKKISLKKKKKKLLSTPMIKEAHLQLYPPSTLYVDYTLREPIAFLSDYENIAVDEEGKLFPFYPFYSPKELPRIYLGNTCLDELSFKSFLKGECFFLAKEILALLKQPAYFADFRVSAIDVSHAFEKSLGKQEIVLDISGGHKESFPYLYHLRLTPSRFKKELGDYLVLHKELIEGLPVESGSLDEKIIDLRIESTAYIEKKD